MDSIRQDEKLLINELYALVKSGYNCFSSNKKIFKLYQKMEYQELTTYSIHELESILENINKTYTPNPTLFSFLKSKEKNVIYERLYNNLNNLLFTSLERKTKNKFCNALLDALMAEYRATISLESNIYKTFMELLNSHIEASDKMSQVYVDYLNGYYKDLQFKFKGVDNYLTTTLPLNYDEIYLKDRLLDELIIKVMQEILNMDNNLEDDLVYAEAMLYQIFLRTLLILLNDYERMQEYEAIYNSWVTIDTPLKNIIVGAFIANYYDMQKQTTKKLQEKSYE